MYTHKWIEVHFWLVIRIKTIFPLFPLSFNLQLKQLLFHGSNTHDQCDSCLNCVCVILFWSFHTLNTCMPDSHLSLSFYFTCFEQLFQLILYYLTKSHVSMFEYIPDSAFARAREKKSIPKEISFLNVWLVVLYPQINIYLDLNNI